MVDINYPLRKAYIAKLASLEYESTPVKVFYQMVPDSIATASETLYVVIDSINSNNISTTNSQDLSATVTITVHSYGNKYSNGRAVDNITGQILGLVCTSPAETFDLSSDNLQAVSNTLESDNINSFTTQGNRMYIDRVVRISHNIFLK